MQSSYLFGLYTKALKSARNEPADDEIEAWRAHWMNSTIQINTESSGANSTVTKSAYVSQIAKYGISDLPQCTCLRSLVFYFDCESVLEIGTSLGVTSRYLADLTSVQSLVTIDSNPEIIQLAKQTLYDAEAEVELITADVSEAIRALVSREKVFDFVFVDANHTYKATVQYFKDLKYLIHDESVIVFDDINWSPEMTRAWNEIKKDEHVTLSCENYEMGLIFFNTKFTKKSYVLDF